MPFNTSSVPPQCCFFKGKLARSVDFILFYFSHLWILDIPSFLAESRKEHIQTAKHSLEAKTKLVRATWSLKVVRLRLLEPIFQASGGKLRLSHRVAGMGVEGGAVAAGGERGEWAGAQTSRLCPNLTGVEWVLVTHMCEHGGEHSGATARSSPGSMPCHLQLSTSVHGLRERKSWKSSPRDVWPTGSHTSAS